MTVKPSYVLSSISFFTAFLVVVLRCDYASLYEVVSVHLSVGPSVRPSVPYHFRTTNMVTFVGKKSSNDIIINDTMSDDKVVASDAPPRYLFLNANGPTDGPTDGYGRTHPLIEMRRRI